MTTIAYCTVPGRLVSLIHDRQYHQYCSSQRLIQGSNLDKVLQYQDEPQGRKLFFQPAGIVWNVSHQCNKLVAWNIPDLQKIWYYIFLHSLFNVKKEVTCITLFQYRY